MFKKKDHAMLEEAYSKVMMNEIHSNVPMDEGDGEGDDNKESISHDFIVRLQGALEVGDYEALKRVTNEFSSFLGDGGAGDDFGHEEEPQSHGGNQGTGHYVSNKQKSKERSEDFLINRMNLKPGKDF
jgi:hypothetical protein